MTGLAEALGHRLGGEAVDLTRLSGGASRETWSFDLVAPGGHRRPLILQRQRGSDAPRGHPPAVEAALLRAGAATGVPVAGLVDTGDDDGLGAPWLVVERLSGETIPRRLLRDEAFREARARLPAQCGRAAAAVHAIPEEQVPGLDDRDQLEALADLMTGVGHPRPALELGLRRLRATRPATGRRTVVHGDLRNGNLLVGPDGLRAVLDWELAHIGDPVEDLGWLCMRTWRFGGPGRAGGFGPAEDLLAAYEQASGHRVDPGDLRWWEAFGALRWAVICLLQASAHLSGASRSVELAAVGRRAYESEWDLLCLLGATPADDGPVPGDGSGGGAGDGGGAPVGPADPGPAHAHPSTAELVEAVQELLAGDVMAATEGRTRFQARVAARTLDVVQRDLVHGRAVARAHGERLQELGAADDAELAAAVREGRLDDRWDEAAGAVAATVRDQLAIANPAWLEPPPG